MDSRISKFRKLLQNKGLNAAIVYKPENRRYLSGFSGSSGYVFITMQNSYFITDFRYLEQAKEECVDYEIIEHNNECTVYDILNSFNILTIGFEDDFITYSQFQEFQKKLNKVQWVPMKGMLSRLRMVKDAQEILYIEKAALIADEAFGYICDYIKPGISEKEIALELENYMKKKGASDTSFETIVASGIRTSLPHGTASDKIIEKGDFITLDFGCVYNGYCSDMTRTIVVGRSNHKQKEIYNIVLEAQLKALEAIQPGILSAEVDKIARDMIDLKGYGKNFGHGLGHGVGLEIHEEPRLSPSGKEILESGMVVTVEPGIYISHFGGVRIEDLVVVNQKGCRILSKSPKQLIEL